MQIHVKSCEDTEGKHFNDSDGVTSDYLYPFYFLVTKKNVLENAGNNNTNTIWGELWPADAAFQEYNLIMINHDYYRSWDVIVNQLKIN